MQLKIATKAHPNIHEKRFTKEGITEQLKTSLTNLQTSCVDIFYLHAPDHNTPIEETLAAVQQLYTGVCVCVCVCLGGGGGGGRDETIKRQRGGTIPK